METDMKVYAIQHHPGEKPFFTATLKEAKELQLDYDPQDRPAIIAFTLKFNNKSCWVDALNGWGMGEPSLISRGGLQFSDEWSG
jgi:hypothetical protein